VRDRPLAACGLLRLPDIPLCSFSLFGGGHVNLLVPETQIGLIVIRLGRTFRLAASGDRQADGQQLVARVDIPLGAAARTGSRD
jgi:hypothetical protein